MDVVRSSVYRSFIRTLYYAGTEVQNIFLNAFKCRSDVQAGDGQNNRLFHSTQKYVRHRHMFRKES